MALSCAFVGGILFLFVCLCESEFTISVMICPFIIRKNVSVISYMNGVLLIGICEEWTDYLCTLAIDYENPITRAFINYHSGINLSSDGLTI